MDEVNLFNVAKTFGISQKKDHPAERGLDQCMELALPLQQIILCTDSLSAKLVVLNK